MNNSYSDSDYVGIDPLFSSRRSPTDDEIDEILGYLVAGEMTDVEFDAAIGRLVRAKSRLLRRLVEMMSSPDPVFHQAASALLREMELTQAVGPLRTLLQAPELDDHHKLSILQALHELGGMSPGEDPFIYLRDPETVVRKSQEDFLQLLQDPVQLELVLRSILEGQLPLLGNDEALAVLASSLDRRLKILFLCLLHAQDNQLVLRAIEGLRLLQDASAVPVLQERAKYDSVASVRRAARQAAKELAAQDASPELTVLDLPVAPPSLVHCLESTIDGNGGQVMLIVRQDAGQPPIFWNVVFNDHQGLKESVGSDDDTLADVEATLAEGMLDIGVDMVEISLQRARTQIDEAYRTTLKMRRRLPPSFLAWRTWLIGEADEVPDVHPVPTVRPDEQGDLLRRSSELFSLEEFDTWVLEADELGGLERRFRRLLDRPGTRDAVNSLISEAIDRLIDVDYRRLLKGRLERQAWLLSQLYVDQDIPKLALAAAAAIGEDADQPLTGHPFLRELMFNSLARSVGVGP